MDAADSIGPPRHLSRLKPGLNSPPRGDYETEGGVVAEFDGSVNDARTSMGGDFNIVAGGGGSGAWSATK